MLNYELENLDVRVKMLDRAVLRNFWFDDQK